MCGRPASCAGSLLVHFSTGVSILNSVTDATLQFRPMAATEADVVAFGECFARNGSERRVDTLRWQYLDNPARELLVDLAVTDERIGAIYAVQPGFA